MSEGKVFGAKDPACLLAKSYPPTLPTYLPTQIIRPRMAYCPIERYPPKDVLEMFAGGLVCRRRVEIRDAY